MKKFTPFDFLDYRDYLRGFFEKRKEEAPWYSYKIFGDGVGLDQSQVFRILQKQLHISKKALPRFVSYLKLSMTEAAYFEKLVALGHSRKEAETRALFSEVLALRGSKSKTLAGDEFELYSQWHHTVIRALLGIAHIKDDYEALGKMVTPPISAAQAKKSVELLHRLGFTKRKSDGFWELTDASLTTGASYSSMFVRAYQAESMKLAVQSLDLHAKELRDISVVNMAVDESAFRDCQEILRAAREEMRARIEKVEDPDRVMRLAIAFFPVAFASGGEKV